jgi:hypothetical protein
MDRVAGVVKNWRDTRLIVEDVHEVRCSRQVWWFGPQTHRSLGLKTQRWRFQRELAAAHSVIVEGVCRRFDLGGSLDRRVNCRRVSQPRWDGARRSTKGGNEETCVKGKPAAFVFVLRPGRVRLQ